MNKASLVELVAEQAQISKAEADRAVSRVLNAMKAGLQRDRSLSLSGFGSFEVRTRKSRNGTHPKTQERIVIREKDTVVFRSSAKLLA